MKLIERNNLIYGRPLNMVSKASYSVFDSWPLSYYMSSPGHISWLDATLLLMNFVTYVCMDVHKAYSLLTNSSMLCRRVQLAVSSLLMSRDSSNFHFEELGNLYPDI